ncbi:TPA: hypothetical protein ACNVSO_004242, partial [Providencia stuartii]
PTYDEIGKALGYSKGLVAHRVRLLAKRDKSVVFPTLCYQPKINKLIFVIYFQNLLDLPPNIICLLAV